MNKFCFALNNVTHYYQPEEPVARAEVGASLPSVVTGVVLPAVPRIFMVSITEVLERLLDFIGGLVLPVLDGQARPPHRVTVSNCNGWHLDVPPLPSYVPLPRSCKITVFKKNFLYNT